MINYKDLSKELNGCLTLAPFLNEINSIIKNLKGKMKLEKITNLFNKNIQIEILEDRELYFITKEFYNLIRNNNFLDKLNIENEQELKNNLNPKNYFSEDEINGFEIYVLPIKPKDETIVVFDDCEIYEDGIYTRVIDFNTLLDLRQEGKIFWNMDCQRETVKEVWRGRYVEKPKIYSKSIIEMTDKMANGKYFGTDITLNVPTNGKEQFIVTKKNNGKYKIVIKLDTYTVLHLIDGNHRMTAGLQARRLCKEQGREFPLRMSVRIMNKDIFIGRNFIYQQAQTNPLDESLTKSMHDSIENRMSFSFNKDSRNNSMYNRIGQTNDDVINMEKLTTLNIFAEGLRYFEIDENDALKERRVKRFLKDFFAYIISYCKEDLKNITKSRKENFKLNKNIFRGYLYLASKLYEDDNWEDLLIDVLDKIDFSKKSNLKEFNLDKENISTKNIKKLEEYIDSIIKEVN